MLFAFLAPSLIEFLLSSGIFNKKPKINFSAFVWEGLHKINSDSLKIIINYGAENPIKINDTSYSISDIDRFLQDDLSNSPKNIPTLRMNLFLSIALYYSKFEGVKSDEINIELFSAVLNSYKLKLGKKHGITIADSMRNFLSALQDRNELTEVVRYVKSNIYYMDRDYQRANEGYRDLLSERWLPQNDFQSHYLYTLWQTAAFKELSQLMKNKLINEDLKSEYSRKLAAFYSNKTVKGILPLTKSQNLVILLMIFIFLFILIIDFSDIYDYFKIYIRFKKDPQIRRKFLMEKLLTTEASKKKFCPLCGGSAATKHKQPFHHEFDICKEDKQILIPQNSCSICGAPLEEGINCRICGFNQKGELDFVFSFDLLTSFLKITYSLCLLYLLFSEAFLHYDYEIIEKAVLFSKAIFIFSISLTLLPFFASDLGFRFFEPLKRFRRIFLISFQKYFSIYIVYFIFQLSPSNATYSNIYFYSIFDLFFFTIHVYFLWKFITFGQEYAFYYSKEIIRFFQGAIFFLALFPIILEITYFYNAFSNGTDSLYASLVYTQAANRISFLLLALAIFLASPKAEFSSKHIYIATFIESLFEHKETIVSFLRLCNFITIAIIFRWYLNHHSANLFMYLNQLLLVAIYQICFGNSTIDQGKRQSSTISGLKYNHNLYMLMFISFFSILSYASIIPLLSSKLDLLSFSANINALYILTIKQIQILIPWMLNKNIAFGIVLFFIISFFIIFPFLKLVRTFRFTALAPALDPHQTLRINLLFKHLEIISITFQKLKSKFDRLQKVKLSVLLLEQRYLLESYPNTSHPRNNETSQILNTIEYELEKDIEEADSSFQCYKHEIANMKDAYYGQIPSIDESPESILIQSIPDIHFLLVWNKKMRNQIIKEEKIFLQISNELFLKSVKLYWESVRLLFDQLSSPIYKGLSPYSISDFNYVAVVISDFPSIPPSIKKLLAIKSHNLKPSDFAYVYFCDNYPQIQTLDFLMMDIETQTAKSTLNSKNDENDLAYKREELRERRVAFLDFIYEIRGMGFRCEYLPVCTTVIIKDGIRTPFSEGEKTDVKGNLVDIKNEYFQAKLLLVIEKTSIDEISKEFEKVLQPRISERLFSRH